MEKIKQCFHLCQSMWRKVQSIGHAQLYTDDENYRCMIKMMTATAFLPVADVLAGFQALRALDTYTDELDAVYDYFEDNYICNYIDNYIIVC